MIKKFLPLVMTAAIAAGAMAHGIDDMIYTRGAKYKVTGPNLVTNGELKGESLDGWTATDDTAASLSDVFTVLEDGGVSVNAGMGDLVDGMYQTLAIPAAGTYVVTMKVRGAGPGHTDVDLYAAGGNYIFAYFNTDGSLSRTDDGMLSYGEGGAAIENCHAFTSEDFTELAFPVEAASDGKIVIDLRGLAAGMEIHDVECHQVQAVFDERKAERRLAWIRSVLGDFGWSDEHAGYGDLQSDMQALEGALRGDDDTSKAAMLENLETCFFEEFAPANLINLFNAIDHPSGVGGDHSANWMNWTARYGECIHEATHQPWVFNCDRWAHQTAAAGTPLQVQWARGHSHDAWDPQARLTTTLDKGSYRLGISGSGGMMTLNKDRMMRSGAYDNVKVEMILEDAGDPTRDVTVLEGVLSPSFDKSFVGSFTLDERKEVTILLHCHPMECPSDKPGVDVSLLDPVLYQLPAKEGSETATPGDLGPVSYWDPVEGRYAECTNYTRYDGRTALTSGWYVVAGDVTTGGRIGISRSVRQAEVNLILCDGAELVANGGIEVAGTEQHHLVIWAQSDGPGAGKLTAIAGDSSAGIGGTHDDDTAADGYMHVVGGEVTINGGRIVAAGAGGADGIGGADEFACERVTINGGTVTATGGGGGGAGIDGGDVAIRGGTVTATGKGGGAAIGGGLAITGMKVGYADGEGRVVSWAAPDQRDAFCRNTDGKSVRLEACAPHDNAGAVCGRCGRKSFLVRKLYDNRHWDKTRYSTVELAVYSEAAKTPDAQGCCLTYVTEGEAIDLTDNLDGNGEHAKLNGVHDIEQTNHFMVPFNTNGLAYLKADLKENSAIRVTGEFGPYHPSYEAEAPNGKDRRMTLSTAGLLNGQTFYVIERSPGDYEPTGYVYVGDDAEADPRVDGDTTGMAPTVTSDYEVEVVTASGSSVTLPPYALYVTGVSTVEPTTVFVVNSFDMNKASPSRVSDVTATASDPWDGLVSLSFRSGGPADQRPVWNPPFLSIVATDTATGSNYVSSASDLFAETPEALTNALYGSGGTVTWDMSAFFPDDFSTTGMVFTVDFLALPEYCVIDLTVGTNGASPAVSYLDAPPEGGWTDLYKTELLPMRLVPPETEGARPFYCALFETTQKQWELVTGGAPSAFPGATRPVERVSWNDIRGDAETCDWPAADAVDEDSFVGILRRRTGLSALDLPTEAQWEFACRGWKTTDYGYGHVPNGDGMWFRDNSGGETHGVGTRTTNFFGLHDMHGNVAEWCLDRASSTGPERVLRGGGWDDYAPACTSSSRSGHDPATGDGHCGFRLVRNLPLDSESERSPEAEPGGRRVGTVPTFDAEDPDNPEIFSYSCASEAIALIRAALHTVSFTWHGGSFETNYPAGTAAADVAVPDDPENYTENGTNYAFTGWSPAAVADVTTNATYTARYGIVPEVEVVSCVVTADGDDDEMSLVLAGPDDCDGVADVAIHEWDTTGAEPVPGEVVWSTNGVALAEGTAELTVSVDTGVVLPGQLVVARYLPNDKYAGATASNRVMGTSSVILAAESVYHVGDNIVLGVEAVNSTGGIAVTLYVPDGNGGLTKYDWECTVVSNTATLGFLPVGEYVVTAVLAGDAHYLGSRDTKSFRVAKIEPGLEAEAAETTEGEPVTVTATLGHDDCTGTVTVAVDGDEYDGAVIEGMAVVSFPGLAAGDYEATVTYSGDDKYLEASTNCTFNVASARPSEEVDGVIWYYERVDGTAVVTGIEEAHATGNLTMPDALDGYAVTAVGTNAFENCSNLTGMALADGVTNIGAWAFSECAGLTNVTFGTNVTAIGEHAFYACTNLTEVAIPGGVTALEDEVFSGCMGLTNVTMGAAVTNIGEAAFAGCVALRKVELPEGLTAIGSQAFVWSGLADVRIPDATADIEGQAFASSPALTNVWLGTGIESVERSAFYDCPNLVAIWVPVEKKEAGLLDGAMLPAGCEIRWYGTQVVTFNANGGTCSVATNGYVIGTPYGELPVATWAAHTFEGWRGADGAPVAATNPATEEAARTLVAAWMNGVVVGGVLWLCETNGAGTVRVTGAEPAEGNMTMPEALDGYAVTEVGARAFDWCTNLTGMVIAGGVTNIGEMAFNGCKGLENVTIPEGVRTIGEAAFAGCIFLRDVTIPDSVTDIGDMAFNDCGSLWGVDFGPGSGVTNIGANAFGRCAELHDAWLPDSVASVGAGAFADCAVLTVVRLGTGIESVGANAFAGCGDLETLWVPIGQKDTGLLDGAGVREGCEIHYYGKQTVTFDADGGWCGTTTNGYEIGKPYGELPEATWKLHTFEGWRGTNGVAVTATDPVTEEAARTLVAAWTNGVIVGNVMWLCETNRDGTVMVTGAEPTEGDMAMPDALDGFAVTAVESSAFYGFTNLTGMVIPDSVKFIGAYAFHSCSNLTNVTLGAGVTDIGAGAFFDCRGLTEVVLPDSVTEIGHQAFAYCASLTNAAIGAGVTNIQYDAFASCTALTDVRIPDRVVTIGNMAFSNCGLLTNVWLGTGIESFGDEPFASCYDLATIWAPIEKKGTDLLANAELPDGCEIRYYGTQRVTFDAKGGTCGTATKDCTIGEEYGELPEARREGHDFLGWWDDAAGVEVTADGVVTEEAARTLTAHWRLSELELTVSAGPWGSAVAVFGGTTNVVAGGTATNFAVRWGSAVTVTAVPDGGFAVDGEATVEVASLTNAATAAFAFLPNPSATLKWKYARNANGWFCAQVAVPWHAGYGEALGNLRFLFADRTDAAGAPTAYLVDTATVFDPLGTVESHEGREYRVAGIETDGFDGKDGGERAVYGVEDGTMESELASVPKAERKIALRVVNRDIDTVAPLDDKIGFLAWETAGTTRYLAVSPDGTAAARGVRTSLRDFDGLEEEPLPDVVVAARTYTVAFHPNGGKGRMARQTMVCGRSARLRKNAFTRGGWAFAGWATSRGGRAVYADRQIVKDLRGGGGTATLYAHWAKRTYTVAFFANGGTGRMARQTMTYGKAAKLRRNAFTKRGWAFAGWATRKGGPVVYRNQAGVKNLRTDGGTTALYAVWTRKAAGKTAAAAPASGAVRPAEPTAGAPAAQGPKGGGGGPGTTTSDGSDGAAAVDGDEGTAWSPEDGAGWAWVVLSFPEALDVADVEVVGDNLPDGMRVLVSEDASEWRETAAGRARYVWVAFPDGEGTPAVREIRVLEAAATAREGR